jgi:protein-disulfide isomerase
MATAQKKQSGVPVIIIVLVLIVAVFIFWWFYNSSRPASVGTNRNANGANAARTATVPTNAPLGAQPPNMLGSPNASVTVEEFADFQCPSCATTHPALKQIQSMYGTRIKFIFRHFPLPMHDKAYDAAVAAEAAGIQGSDKFWAMHNQLYTNQQAWSSDPNYKATFRSYAERLGLNMTQYDTDVAGIQAKGRVDADIQRGRGLNVSSTPSVYINGKSVPYPEMNVPTMKQLIDAELQSAQPAPAANAAASSANRTNQ